MSDTEPKPIRVLVVDGEPTLLRALEALLEKQGCEVVGLDSPVAATQRLAAEDFDVALLDVGMPQLSGLELLEAVKHRRPEMEVIMTTGSATVETALQAVEGGAYDYLTKPFEDVGRVARSVAKAAERKALAGRNRQLENRLREREGLPPAVAGHTGPRVRGAPAGGEAQQWFTQRYATAKEQALRRFERSYVEALMKACDDNISAAARQAGMDRSNFKRVLRKYRTDARPVGPGEESSLPA